MSGTVAIVTLGCKTNQFESAAMAEQLGLTGYRQVDLNSPADLVIINTCTVTAATDAQSRKLIRRAQRLNPKARIVVTGCYAQVDPQALQSLPGVALVLGNQDKLELLKQLELPDGTAQVSTISPTARLEALNLKGFAGRSRAFVQIQNGCNAACSYCIIPRARGASRSVPLPEVIEQVTGLSAAGYPEIVLTGIHIGCYGADLSPARSLLELLRAIEQSDFSGRLRLGSIEPTELSPELYEYILASDWICPHFHIPLQAGSDEVLQRMNRPYRSDFFASLIDSLHSNNPDAAIGMDIISGFPGESEQQFSSTCDFLESLPFSHLHVFPYSRRKGTLAAGLPDQLPAGIIKERAAQLRAIGERKLALFADRFTGRTLEAVIESSDKAGHHKGLTQNYLTVQLAAQGLNKGDCQPVAITAARDGILSGVACR